jgi:hypothetical protein
MPRLSRTYHLSFPESSVPSPIRALIIDNINGSSKSIEIRDGTQIMYLPKKTSVSAVSANIDIGVSMSIQ